MVWILDDERRGIVLRAVIDDYTVYHRPVPSRMIAPKVKFSPATIRHVMAELEERGHLKKTHISAGRIPTDRGYRFYIDELMERESLTRGEEREIEGIFRVRDQPQKVIRMVPRYLSKTFHLLGITLSPEHEIFIDGRGDILEEPEFSNINRAKRIFRFLEERDRLFPILESHARDEGVRVSIGKENKCEAINDCSLVTATFSLNEGMRGVLGIIGPTRMRYLKIIPVIDFISKRLSRILTGKDR